MKKYLFTHNASVKYVQSANFACDEPIKNACHQKINRIVLTYLFRPTKLCLLTYLPRQPIFRPSLLA